MIILKQKIIHRFAERYGSPDMITCYSDTRGFSAISPQAILLINQHHLIVLYIGLLSNKLVQRVDFQLTEISNSKLKSGFFFSTIWQFNAKNQKWKFVIPYVIPLKDNQKQFIEYLYAFRFY